MDIEVLITALPKIYEWLLSHAYIVVRAVPDFGLPLIMVVVGSGLILFLGWELMNER